MKPISGGFVCAAGDGKVGACALITPVYLEIALMSGARSGTQVTGQVISAIDIADTSIHALREEGDVAQPALEAVPLRISIHAPARRTTCLCDTDVRAGNISIHALREEGDTRLKS